MSRIAKWVILISFIIVIDECAEASYKRYEFTAKEVYLMAQVVTGECVIDPNNIKTEEIYKVLCVIMNRQRHPKFPNTVHGVVMAPGQFHVVPRVLKIQPKWIVLYLVNEWCFAYDRYETKFIQIIPENHLYFGGNGKINRTRARY